MKPGIVEVGFGERKDEEVGKKKLNEAEAG
jgi:hypothetical protein